MRIVTGTVACVIGLLLTGSIASWAGDPDNRLEREIRYKVDMTALREEFISSGTVRLEVPELGELVVEGERTKVREGDQYSIMHADGTTTYHRDESIPLSGRVRGLPASTATLLLGDYAVYGGITVPGADFRFKPFIHDDRRTFDQVVTAEYVSAGAVDALKTAFSVPAEAVNLQSFMLLDCSVVPAPQECPWPCSATQSLVQGDVTAPVLNQRPDWKDMVISAMQGHHGSYEMWKDVCIELLLKDGSPRGLAFVITTTGNIRQSLADYQNWLNADQTRLTNANAYQLWVADDLWKCSNGDYLYTCDSSHVDYLPLAVAKIDAAVKDVATEPLHVQAAAVTVVQGLKGDSVYSPYDPWDTARVSAHELSHVYGEQSHRVHCKDSSTCNIMSETLSNSLATYWIDESRCQVYRWYFHKESAYSAGEECPNWYQP